MAKQAKGKAGDQASGSAEPSLKAWRVLYDQAIALRNLAPWTWMAEDELFAVADPDSGEIGYCSVMGGAGTFLALSVYWGVEGLSAYREMQAAKSHAETVEAYTNQRTLMVSFEDSKAADARDRKVFSALGYKFRGAHNWPILRSHQPARVPWTLTAQEARFLTVVQQQTLEMVQRVREDPGVLMGWDEDKILCRRVKADPTKPQSTDSAQVTYSNPSMQGGQDLWEDVWMSITPVQPTPVPTIEVDNMRILRILRHAKSTPLWEVDIAYGRMTVSDVTPPRIPRLMVVADAKSGMIIHMEALDPSDYEATFVDRLLTAMEQTKLHPKRIVTVTPRLKALLDPIIYRLGGRVSLVEEVPLVADIRAELDRGEW